MHSLHLSTPQPACHYYWSRVSGTARRGSGRIVHQTPNAALADLCPDLIYTDVYDYDEQNHTRARDRLGNAEGGRFPPSRPRAVGRHRISPPLWGRQRETVAIHRVLILLPSLGMFFG